MDRHMSLRPLGGRGHCTPARVLRGLGWLAVLLGAVVVLGFLLELTRMRAADDWKACWLLVQITMMSLRPLIAAAVPLFGFAALLDALYRGAARSYLITWEEAEP